MQQGGVGLSIKVLFNFSTLVLSGHILMSMGSRHVSILCSHTVFRIFNFPAAILDVWLVLMC
jgi:hypothetical protein